MLLIRLILAERFHNNEEAKDGCMKRLIHQFMEEQLNGTSEENQVDNNSFVYFEKSTLNLLLLYLLTNESRGSEKEDLMKISEELERMIADQEKEFERIIQLLKESI